MQKRKENILTAILFIGIILHFGIGYFLWDEITVVNIYYVSVYFLGDVCGFVIFLISQGNLLKGGGMLMMGLSTYYLYMEFNDPTYWIERDYITLGMVFANVFFIWFFTSKFKDKNL